MVHGILQARILEWVAFPFSRATSRPRYFATPWTEEPGSSVHGIFQARVLEWVAISFSRGSSQPRDWTWVSHIAGRRFTIWATRSMKVLTWPWPDCKDQRISWTYAKFKIHMHFQGRISWHLEPKRDLWLSLNTLVIWSLKGEWQKIKPMRSPGPSMCAM